ncbi:unnamed protein product [marine sediment metagenome]|uniref:SpoVT-AbrB domain-containing protein n=1 Tax=marine sediment metagenome TaxID=412755 RepID=X1I6M0_9ZZZZ
MSLITKSKAFKHPSGGGQIHIPEAVWNQYKIENGDTIQWWRYEEEEEFIDESKNLIVLRVVKENVHPR